MLAGEQLATSVGYITFASPGNDSDKHETRTINREARNAAKFIKYYTSVAKHMQRRCRYTVTIHILLLLLLYKTRMAYKIITAERDVSKLFM
jgi:hypothetical protein